MMNWSQIEALLAAEDFGTAPHPDEIEWSEEPEPGPSSGPQGVVQGFMRPGVVQLVKKYNPATLVSADTTAVRAKLGRGAPKAIGAKGYLTHTFSGRQYYFKSDAQKRTIRYQGALSVVKGGRTATKKTKNKRKADENAHLIAHSLGGDPYFTQGYVAMSQNINRNNGDWYRMEGYIRNRLKANKTKAYMAVKPHYPTPSIKRPDYIEVSVYFNRAPYKLKFKIPTP